MAKILCLEGKILIGTSIKGRDIRDRSAEREVPERERSGEQAESAAHSPLRLPNASLTS